MASQYYKNVFHWIQFIVVFNSLSNSKHEPVSFFAERNNNKKICIKDPDGKLLPYQVIKNNCLPF